jgi:ATP phosphoribosyltransferase
VRERRPLDSLLDLGFGRCRIVVAAKDDARVRTVDDIGAPTAGRPVRVATVFPHITRRFFAEAGRASRSRPSRAPSRSPRTSASPT